jgi:ABC-2 type transport system permease protein
VGAVVRNQVAAVVGLCVWLLFLEPLLLGDIPSAAKYAPEASAGAIAGAIQSQIADTLIAPALGIVLLAAYAALAGLAGSLLITRRDVG